MRRLRRAALALAALALGVAAALVLGEGAAAVHHYLSTGKLFYLDGAARAAAAYDWRHADGRPVDEARALAGQLHPHLGYVALPNSVLTQADGTVSRANNFGFVYLDEPAPDYPYRPADPQEFLVGVFGGSVANNVGRSTSTLAARLQRLDALRDRRVRVLNFAMGGYKQPQSLVALAMFQALGQRLDLVITVDGFNEVALSLMNFRAGDEPTAPAISPFRILRDAADGQMLSADRAIVLSEIFALRLRAQRADRARRATPFALVHFVASQVKTLAERQVSRLTYAYYDLPADAGWERSLFHGRFRPPPADAAALFAAVADHWAASARQMAALAAAGGARYLHVLQPNQYLTRHEFGPEERALAIDPSPDNAYAAGVRGGYPELLARLPALRAAGVRIASAVELFDDEPRAVWRDACCHLNQLGDELFAQFIADRAAEALR